MKYFKRAWMQGLSLLRALSRLVVEHKEALLNSIAAVGALLLGVLIVGVMLIQRNVISDWFLAWALATVAVPVILMQAHRHVLGELGGSLANIAQGVEGRREKIETLVHAIWQPYVRAISGRDAVCVAAAQTIKRAHSEPDYGERYIIFQGAASLSTSSKREEEWGVLEPDEDTITPYQLYSGALDDAVSDNLRMRRYIRLPTAEELSGRSSFLARDYLDWHMKEFYRLKRDENYVITDALRAPEWRSGVSTILTRRAILFVVGKGEAALLVQDDRIAELIRTAYNKSMVAAEVRAVYGEPGVDRKKSVDRFRDWVKKVKQMAGEAP